MLPESPETFMRNWENQGSSARLKYNGKSPLKDSSTIKKEPVMINHTKGKNDHEQKSTTPEKMRGYKNL